MENYLFEIDNVRNDLGFLGFLENGKTPFEIRRLYYITDVSAGVRRGHHGHKKLQQVLICPIGSFEVKIINKYGEKNYVLDKPNIGLYVPEMSWRELYNFSKPSLCMVLASETYDKEDYMFNFQDFSNLIQTPN
jgi:hypothetical protein